MNIGLFNSTLFITIICLVLVFALLSLLVSSLTEALNSYFEERARLLHQVIGSLFEDGVNPNFGQLLYSHPMVDNLKRDKNSLPAYIPAAIFSKAITDVIANTARTYVAKPGEQVMTPVGDTRSAFDRFKAGVDAMAQTPIKLLLLNMLDRCLAEGGANSFGQLENELQQWYNSQMDRVSGWYKKWVRHRLVWMSLVVALALNVDSIYLFQSLYRSPDLRARLEPVAEGLAANYASVRGDSSLSTMQQLYKAEELTRFPRDTAQADSMFRYMDRAIGGLQKMDSLLRLQDSARARDWNHAKQEVNDIQSLGLPAGWSKGVAPVSWFYKDSTSVQNPDYFHERQRPTFWNIVLYLLGLAITTFSLSAGAPFWFDLLLKLVNLRRTGTRPATITSTK